MLQVVSDSASFVKISGPLYAAMGLILGYRWPTHVLPIGAGLGLPLLLVGIPYAAGGLDDYGPDVSHWLAVNALIFGIPPLAGLVGALIGPLLRLRRRSS